MYWWQRTPLLCWHDSRVLWVQVALKLLITTYSAESPPLRLTGRFVIDWRADLHSNEGSFFILCDCLSPWESMLPLQHLYWHPEYCSIIVVCTELFLPRLHFSFLFFFGILLSGKTVHWITIIILFTDMWVRRCWLLRLRVCLITKSMTASDMLQLMPRRGY